MRGEVLNDVPAERYREAFERAGVAMALVDPAGRIARANAALGALIGREPAALAGRDARELLPPGDRDGDLPAGECRLQRADGRTVWVQLDATPVHGGHVFVHLCELPVRDRDVVTGLPSRARFDAAVAQHASHVQRYGAEGAVIVVDLDGFRSLNARLGPIAADGLLCSVAEALRRRLRTTDMVARTADEFRILLPRGTAGDAMTVAHDLLAAVGRVAEITASVGVAPFSDPDDPLAVVQRAHAALAEVRRAGGDGVAAAVHRAAAA